MLPIALVVALVVALAWASRGDAAKPGSAGPRQFGDGADKRVITAGKRYLWTVHIRPPFPSADAMDAFMENFASVQPAETAWEFVALGTQTIDGQPTEVLKYKSTQLVTHTVGLPWRMLEVGATSLTAVDAREVG